MSIKRTIITTILALAVVAVAVPGVNAATIDELLAQIAALQAQLVALQGGSSTGSATGACVGVTFSRSLTVGSTGSDVRCLQQLVGNTITGTFGPNTKMKVQAFQTSKGIQATGFVGPLTRAALTTAMGSTTGTGTGTGTTPVVTTPGAEGSVIVTASPSPASGTDIYTGRTGVAVSAVDVKATGSDVAVNRVTLNFNVRPWLYISKLTVSDGTTSQSVAVTSANTTEVTIGSSYDVRIEGLNMVVAKDTTKKLTFSVDAVSALPVGTNSQAVIVTVPQNAVRGTDGAGLSQYGPLSALTVTRTFTVKNGDTATITVSSSSDTPKAGNVFVSETAKTDGVTMLKFNIEAKNNDFILRNVRVNATNSSGTLDLVMPTLKLLDGTTELASTSTAASSTFGELNLRIPAGTTKTLTVVASLAKTNTSVLCEGDAVAVNLTSVASVDGEDATTYATVTGTATTVAANNQYAWLKAPVFALEGSPTIASYKTTANSSTYAAKAEIKVRVTARGGDIYLVDWNATNASSGVTAQAQGAAGSSTITSAFNVSGVTAGTYTYKIAKDDSKVVTLTADMFNADPYTAHYDGISVANIKWTTDDSTDTDGVVQTWGLDDLKTGLTQLDGVY